MKTKTHKKRMTKYGMKLNILSNQKKKKSNNSNNLMKNIRKLNSVQMMMYLRKKTL